MVKQMSRQNFFRILIGILALVVTVFGGRSAVFAQTEVIISPELLSLIRQNCSNSLFSLQQIEKRDAVSRINRGRSYDQMLTQVSALNSRFAYNKISVPDLIQLTNDVQTAVDKFRADYDTYDSDLGDALAADCKSKPDTYYGAIVKARVDRAAVGDQIKVVSALMDQYRSAVLTYRDKVE